MDKPAPVLGNPAQEVRVLEVLPLPRAGLPGVQADRVATPGQVTAELYIVACGDPRRSLTHGDRFGAAEYAVRPGASRQGPGQARGVKGPLDVIHRDHRGAGGELGGYLLSPFLFVAGGTEHLRGVARADYRDGLGEQGAAGPCLWLVDERQRYGPVHGGPYQWCEHERQRVCR